MTRKLKSTQASAPGHPTARGSLGRTKFSLSVKPWISYNDRTKVLSVSVHPAFLHDAEGNYVRDGADGYFRRTFRPNRIFRAMENVTGTDTIWDGVRRNVPGALSQIARAIEETYQHEEDYADTELPSVLKIRGSSICVSSTQEKVPIILPEGETWLYRPPSQVTPQNLALPRVRMTVGDHPTAPGSTISRIVVKIEGTIDDTRRGSLGAIITDSVDVYSERFADLIYTIRDELQLETLAETDRNTAAHNEAVRQTEETIRSLAEALCQQRSCSLVLPVLIDVDRMRGSKHEYAAPWEYTRKAPGFPAIKVGVTADYRRITKKSSGVSTT